jgi:sporulation protein YlmC with PRC-barrel domain
MEYFEVKDLIGKPIYTTSGKKVGEVEKAVFLKDGKGALILKNTDQIVLMETVRSISDIILVGDTETPTRIATEEIQSETSENLANSTSSAPIGKPYAEPDRLADIDSTSPFEKLSQSAFIEAMRGVRQEHSRVSVKNAALSGLLGSDPYKGLNELLTYLAESLIPHEKMEEDSVFPVITQRQPSKEYLVKELGKDHQWINDNCAQLRRNVASGKILESKRLAQDILGHMSDHYRREESLFQQVLQEYGSI